jgi:hypothetical protein
MWLRYGTGRYVSPCLGVCLQSPWFNYFCSGFGCCSGPRIHESKTSIRATSPGVVIAHLSYRQHYYNRCSSRTVTTHLMVGSDCAVSLLCITTRSLIQLVLQYLDNYFTFASSDSAPVSLPLCLSVHHQYFLLIVRLVQCIGCANYKRRTVCFLLSFVSFSLLFHIKA